MTKERRCAVIASKQYLALWAASALATQSQGTELLC